MSASIPPSSLGPATPRPLCPWLAWLVRIATILALLAVFALYTQPDFMVLLANQVWSCL